MLLLLSQRTTLQQLPKAWRYHLPAPPRIPCSTTANPPRIPSSSNRTLSTSHRHSLTRKESSSTPRKPVVSDNTSSGGNDNPTMPAFSMDGLGASRTVKIVVYTAIAIMGTVETLAYGRWIWSKLYPSPPSPPPDEEGGGGEAAGAVD